MYKINFCNIQNLIFLGLVVALTRSFPFPVLADFVQLFFIMFIILMIIKLKSKYLFEILFLTGIICFLSMYSMFQGNKPELIIRFASILFFLIIAVDSSAIKALWKSFIIVMVVQSVVVIGISLFLYFLQDLALLGLSRAALITNAAGDIYTLDGVFWRVQLKANALLPVALFVSHIRTLGKTRIFLSVIFGSAILASGNFAFILGLVFFYGYIAFKEFYAAQVDRKIFLLFIVSLGIILFFSPIISYIENQLLIKSAYSNPHRLIQLNDFLFYLNSNFYGALFGKGLGSEVLGETRDYVDNIYFELQTIYVLVQLGLLFFCVFYLYFLMKLYHRLSLSLFMAYISYLVYSFWNPYVFDLNNFIVIVVLLSANLSEDRDANMCRNNHFQPKY